MVFVHQNNKDEKMVNRVLVSVKNAYTLLVISINCYNFFGGQSGNISKLCDVYDVYTS